MNHETYTEVLKQVRDGLEALNAECKSLRAVLYATNGDSEKKGLIEQVHDNTEHRQKQEKSGEKLKWLLIAQTCTFLFFVLSRVWQ